MKKLIFPLVTLLVLMSCADDNPQPASPFVGSWQLINQDIEISFDVVYEGSGIYNYPNRRVVHPAIPVDQQSNNNMITYDKFANGSGYGLIEITSRGPVQYQIRMIYNRFTDEGIAVYDVQVELPNTPMFVLQDQMFVRTD